jgi:hypothetical protein
MSPAIEPASAISREAIITACGMRVPPPWSIIASNSVSLIAPTPNLSIRSCGCSLHAISGARSPELSVKPNVD